MGSQYYLVAAFFTLQITSASVVARKEVDAPSIGQLQVTADDASQVLLGRGVSRKEAAEFANESVASPEQAEAGHISAVTRKQATPDEALAVKPPGVDEANLSRREARNPVQSGYVSVEVSPKGEVSSKRLQNMTSALEIGATFNQTHDHGRNVVYSSDHGTVGVDVTSSSHSFESLAERQHQEQSRNSSRREEMYYGLIVIGLVGVLAAAPLLMLWHGNFRTRVERRMSGIRAHATSLSVASEVASGASVTHAHDHTLTPAGSTSSNVLDIQGRPSIQRPSVVANSSSKRPSTYSQAISQGSKKGVISQDESTENAQAKLEAKETLGSLSTAAPTDTTRTAASGAAGDPQGAEKLEDISTTRSVGPLSGGGDEAKLQQSRTSKST